MAKTVDQSKDRLSTKKSSKPHKSEQSELPTPWDTAIAEAEQRIKDFRFSIRVFRKMKAKGAEWRGLEAQKSPQEGG